MSNLPLGGDNWATSDPGNKLQIRGFVQPFKNEHTIFGENEKRKAYNERKYTNIRKDRPTM